ncbi:MAG: hypothetical protein KDC54_02380, partial [Lewinella sp.]|nr:hypothetical protein [Lewinella sp.]
MFLLAVIFGLHPAQATTTALPAPSNTTVVDCPAVGPMTWTGAADTNWDNPSNWNPECVPTIDNEVSIPPTTILPIIAAGTSAEAKSVHIEAGASLLLDVTASLTIHGSTDGGILNEGILQNAGEIMIGITASPGTYGLVTLGQVDNYPNGIIRIDQTSGIALWLQSGMFTNEGQVIIGEAVSGGSPGLYNEATFENEDTGLLRIDRSFGAGIHNLAGSFLFNVGQIEIGQTIPLNTVGIYNFSEIINESAGSILITGQDYLAGIDNQTDAIFTNRGQVQLTRASPGIYNRGEFQHQAGLIDIDGGGTGRSGIHNAIAGFFTSAASIQISNLISYSPGIYQDSSLPFINGAGSELRVNTAGVGIHVNYGNRFENNGQIILGDEEGTNFNVGITNYGTFDHQFGLLQIDRVNDNSGSFSAIYNTGTFNSHASIVIGSLAQGGGTGVYNGLVFHNHSSGSISIERTSQQGLFNGDEFINESTIDIGQSTAIGQHGLVNQDIFDNRSTGVINIDRSTQQGIYLNYQFTNAGLINIGQHEAIGQHGLIMGFGGDFQNDGTINIDRATMHGCYFSYGTVDNSGIIRIGAQASVGDWGLYNGSAAITNETGGALYIDRSNISGLRHTGQSLTNHGLIELGSQAGIGDWGLWSAAQLDNQATGRIRINNTANTGLMVMSNTLTNAGEILVGDAAPVGDQAVYNEATLVNAPCAEMRIFAPFYNVSAFTQEGLFHV